MSTLFVETHYKGLHLFQTLKCINDINDQCVSDQNVQMYKRTNDINNNKMYKMYECIICVKYNMNIKYTKCTNICNVKCTNCLKCINDWNDTKTGKKIQKK